MYIKLPAIIVYVNNKYVVLCLMVGHIKN